MEATQLFISWGCIHVYTCVHNVVEMDADLTSQVPIDIHTEILKGAKRTGHPAIAANGQAIADDRANQLTVNAFASPQCRRHTTAIAPHSQCT